MPKGISLLFVICVLLEALWCLGRILGDGDWFTALLFYIPSPVVLSFLLLMSLVFLKKRIKLYLSLSIVMCFFPLASILLFENQWWKSRQDDNHAVKLVHWNIHSGKSDLDAVMRILQSQAADIYAITEPPMQLHKFISIFSQGYDVASTQHLLLAVKGKIQKKIWLYNKNGFRIWYFKIRTEERNLTLFLVDLASRINLARDPYLQKLNKFIRQYKPNLVVGDFNAPRLSGALQNLPNHYTHAYYLAGSGWSYTWPVPLPVLAIDHILVSQKISVVSYVLETYWVSDHRMQKMLFN